MFMDLGMNIVPLGATPSWHITIYSKQYEHGTRAKVRIQTLKCYCTSRKGEGKLYLFREQLHDEDVFGEWRYSSMHS